MDILTPRIGLMKYCDVYRWWLKPTHLKHMRKSQIGLFPQGIGVKIPKIFEVSPPS